MNLVLIKNFLKKNKKLKKIIKFIYLKMHSSRFLLEYKKVQKHYDIVIKSIQKKAASGNKISVGFYVVYDSTFSAKPLFEKILSDNNFIPCIVIAPDIARGHENMIFQLNKSYQTFLNLYGKKSVFLGYNQQNNDFIDYSERFDIIHFSNPYDDMTHKFFQIMYLKNKNLLTLHTNYGYLSVDNYSHEHIINLPFMNYSWKVFAETEFGYKEFCKYEAIKGKNVTLTGYCKLDEYAKQEKKHYHRKRIILAPHHTVADESQEIFGLSNFLKYTDFFLNLPNMYPDIDFIFRPHPLLFVALKRDDIWGKEKTDTYLEKLLSFNNVIYSDGGIYYDIFKNSDAIIHDCASFLVEYLVTGYPCCYMLKNNTQIDDLFSELGKECLDLYYKAYNENEITYFIDNYVVAGNDIDKEKRTNFAKQKLMINYPNVSEKILSVIKDAIFVS
jgi:hypothetical protein